MTRDYHHRHGKVCFTLKLCQALPGLLTVRFKWPRGEGITLVIFGLLPCKTAPCFWCTALAWLGSLTAWQRAWRLGRIQQRMHHRRRQANAIADASAKLQCASQASTLFPRAYVCPSLRSPRAGLAPLPPETRPPLALCGAARSATAPESTSSRGSAVTACGWASTPTSAIFCSVASAQAVRAKRLRRNKEINVDIVTLSCRTVNFFSPISGGRGAGRVRNRDLERHELPPD